MAEHVLATPSLPQEILLLADQVTSSTPSASFGAEVQDVTSGTTADKGTSITPVMDSSSLSSNHVPDLASGAASAPTYPTQDLVEVIDATPVPLTTFTCFTNLPAELRAKIWKYAANVPQVFELDIYRCSHTPQDITPSRSILRVNNESRAEALRFCHPIILQSERLACRSIGKVWFNSEVDILLLSIPPYWMRNRAETLRPIHNKEVLEKIKHIAFRSVYNRTIYNKKKGFEVLYRLLPSLREITTSDCSVLYAELLLNENLKVLSEDDIAECDKPEITKTWIGMHEKAIDKCLEEGMWKGRRPLIRVVKNGWR